MPRKIIIDTDPGVDDVLAIILALASPEVDVLLFSIVFGNTHAPAAYENLLKVYALLGREIAAFPKALERFPGLTKEPRVKLALGENAPVGGEKAVAAYFHGLDGLSNISDSHPEWTPPPLAAGAKHPYLDIELRKAWEVMLDKLREEPEGEVTIIALGPLTNLAHAYQRDPETFARAAGVVWMGGTLEHSGNTAPNSEFNCYADPYAASLLLNAIKEGKFRLVMAPLDITTPHQIPFTDLIHPSIIGAAAAKGAHGPEEILQTSLHGNAADVVATVDATPIPGWHKPPSPIEAFVGAMLLRVRGLHQSFGIHDAMEQHDPLATWYGILHPAPFEWDNAAPTHSAGGWTTTARDFQIERKGEFTRGMCVVDRRGTAGETGDRTKHDIADGGDLPKPAVPEPKGRMGEDVAHAKALPRVVTGTPGVGVLRKLILERVLGRTVA